MGASISKKELIIEAAVKVFASQGYYNSRISDIVKEAHTAHGLFYHYYPSKEDILVTIFRNAFGAVLEKMAESIGDFSGWTAETPNFEGIRVQCSGKCEEGWFLLRLSLHDPVMPLNVESNLQGGIAFIVKKLKSLMEPFKQLDNSHLYL